LIANAQTSDRNHLVRNAIEGDGEAVDALWRENRGWVVAVLLAYKPGYAELDDLLQDVAMTMVSKIHTLREDHLFRGWLRVIAVNMARGAARSGKNRPAASGDLDQLTGYENSAHQVDIHDETTRVWNRVHDLPEKYREPLLLRAVRGLKSSVIAEILGISEPTVDTRVARARKMLRNQTAPHDLETVATPQMKGREYRHD